MCCASCACAAPVFYYLNYGHDWAAEAPASREIAEAVMPGAEHVMEYHVITKGAGWAAIVGDSRFGSPRGTS